MTEEQKFLKAAAMGLLAAVAEEHPKGHQRRDGARFVLTSKFGADVEIMFEKDDKHPPNLWCLEKAAGAALIRKFRPTPKPASALWTSIGSDGKPEYGRHSALKPMPQLREADLVYFTLRSLGELGEIIDRLRSITAADLV